MNGMSILGSCDRIHRPPNLSSFESLVSSLSGISTARPGSYRTRNRKPDTRNYRMYELLQRYGLWAVFFGTMIEGDLTLLFAGVLARAGVFSFGEALMVGTAGGFVGDSISYLIGARFRGKAHSLHF